MALQSGMTYIDLQTDREKRIQDSLNDTDFNFNNIGCMVNGAGLAMATNDLIHQLGGTCSNFLDIGGQVEEGQISRAINLLTKNPKIDVIFINIFGGIIDCPLIAKGIVKALQEQLLASSISHIEKPHFHSSKFTRCEN